MSHQLAHSFGNYGKNQRALVCALPHAPMEDESMKLILMNYLILTTPPFSLLGGQIIDVEDNFNGRG